MRRSAQQLFVIARTTALEGLQQPICLLLTLTATTFIGLGPLVQLHHFGEAGRVARDSGLAFTLSFGLMIVGFTAGFTVADEIRRGTAAAALAKPVPRGIFLAGKWLGVVLVLLACCTATTLATLLAERTAERFVETEAYVGATIDRYSGIGALLAIGGALLLAAALNFFYRVRFGLAVLLGLLGAQGLVILACGWIDRTGATLARFSLQLNPRVLPAAALIVLLLCLCAAFATALSTRLRTPSTLCALVGLVFFGFLSDGLRERSAGIASRVLYTIIPDVQHFWMADALASTGTIPPAYLLAALRYTLLCCLLWLGLGTWCLRSRDIG